MMRNFHATSTADTQISDEPLIPERITAFIQNQGSLRLRQDEVYCPSASNQTISRKRLPFASFVPSIPSTNMDYRTGFSQGSRAVRYRQDPKNTRAQNRSRPIVEGEEIKSSYSHLEDTLKTSNRASFNFSLEVLFSKYLSSPESSTQIRRKVKNSHRGSTRLVQNFTIASATSSTHHSSSI